MKYENKGLNHGYTNRILTIDLDNGTINVPVLDSEVRDFFTGGRGLGLYPRKRYGRRPVLLFNLQWSKPDDGKLPPQGHGSRWRP